MIEILVENARTKIVGKLHSDPEICDAYHRALRTDLGYMIKGVGWSPKYQDNTWDGVISLYTKRDQSFPTGLISNVKETFDVLKIPYKIVDARVRPESNAKIETLFEQNNRTLRFYQEDAVRKALKHQRGVLSLCTGAGKTFLACELLARLSIKPVVFFVPGKSLLHQTHNEFSQYLQQDGKPAKIGRAGDSICDLNPDGINIMTSATGLAAYNEIYRKTKDKVEKNVREEEKEKKTHLQLKNEYAEQKKCLEALQAKIPNTNLLELRLIPKELANIAPEIRNVKNAYNKSRLALENKEKAIKNKAQIRWIIENSKCVIFDETHLAAVVVQTLGEHAKKAYYRYGMSATPFREDNQEIRIQGTLGRILVSISASMLIKLGYLVPPRVFMFKIDHLETADTYPEMYRKNITDCWIRNWRIKRCAEEFKAAGYPVLIAVELKEHGSLLEAMIKDSVFVPGTGTEADLEGDDEEVDDEIKNYRKKMLQKTAKNEIILIGTQWVNVGIDEPGLRVLIKAGSSKSANTSKQQDGRVMRCLGKDIQESIFNGKSECIIIDFMDMQEHLHKHSIIRKKLYKLEDAFECNVVV